MLRELLGVCLPVLLSTPFLDPRAVRPADDAFRGWVVWVLEARVEMYFMGAGGLYGGRVVAVTEDTITVWRRGALRPRMLAVAPPLLSDRIPLTSDRGMGYRLRDVRLRDMVDLDVVYVRDGFVCTGIGIARRPGGKIPPGEDPPGMPEFARRHHFYNRLQFMEEHVIPNLPKLVSPVPARLLR